MASRTVALRVRTADLVNIEIITTHLRSHGDTFAGLSDAIRHAIAATAAATASKASAAPRDDA